MINLVVATRNEHKVREIGKILGASVHCLPMNEFAGAPDLIEHGSTFAENATAKATQLARWLIDHPEQCRNLVSTGASFVIADDSGLEVDALNGAPGVHSARFAALDSGAPGNSTDVENNAKLIRLLETVPLELRSARFRCVLALIRIHRSGQENSRLNLRAIAPQLPVEIFEGICQGRVALAADGKGGFGYDPWFIPDGYQRSFGELDESLKNQISHRARALMALRRRLLRET